MGEIIKPMDIEKESFRIITEELGKTDLSDKELILKHNIASIVSVGRKGGSNVAAAIINAMLYQAFER